MWNICIYDYNRIKKNIFTLSEDCFGRFPRLLSPFEGKINL